MERRSIARTEHPERHSLVAYVGAELELHRDVGDEVALRVRLAEPEPKNWRRIYSAMALVEQLLQRGLTAMT